MGHQQPDDSQFDQVLVEILRQIDAGAWPHRESLQAQYPQFSAQIDEYLTAYAQVGVAVDQSHHSAPTPAKGIASPGNGTAHPPPGLDELGYDVGEIIGCGGMGVVFRGRQRATGKAVALKVLPPHLAIDSERLARFRHEAQVAAEVKGAHILPVLVTLEVNGSPVLVLPHMPFDLGQVIRLRASLGGQSPHSSLPAWKDDPPELWVENVLRIGDQLLLALARLEEARVIHRDIKPSNILLDHDGEIWLSDFGLARYRDRSWLTRPGDALGTLGFMAPEQLACRRDIDARADMFSVAATLYQALTMDYAYPAGWSERLEAPPPLAPSAFCPSLNRSLDQVLLRALALDRRRRFASCAAFLAAWQRARGNRESPRGLWERLRAVGKLWRPSREAIRQ